ncbi:hypothetical protein D3C73_1649240 [compost metagenome]
MKHGRKDDDDEGSETDDQPESGEPRCIVLLRNDEQDRQDNRIQDADGDRAVSNAL